MVGAQADAKASGAAMTTAVLKLAESGWSPCGGQVIVALTACEEVGTSDNGLLTLRPHLPPIHAALVGEPTSLQPIIAQKGLLVLKATAHGKSAHAARAHLGVNAITMAAADICRLSSHAFLRGGSALGCPTLCATTIEGGTARNVVPDRCTFYVDIRSTPAYSHEQITREIDAYLQSEISVHSGHIIPVSTPVQAHIVQSCLRAPSWRTAVRLFYGQRLDTPARPARGQDRPGQKRALAYGQRACGYAGGLPRRSRLRTDHQNLFRRLNL